MLLFLVSFIFAATTMNKPVAIGNYSSPLTINVTVESNVANNITNVTCYYNASGGIAGIFLTEILNDSVGDLDFTNSTIVTTGLTDGSLYNISCAIYNGTTLNSTISVSNVTIDNTVPNVTLLTIPTSSGGYKDSIVLNVSVNDVLIGMDSVLFNITNSTGHQNATYYSSNLAGSYWNATINTSNFVDGIYNITIWANDSLNNLNNSIVASSVAFDNTAPVVSLTLASNTGSSIELDIGVDDLTSVTCFSSRTGATISGNVLTEVGLECGTSYDYIVTCNDTAENSGASSSTSFSTEVCGISSSSSGTSSWTMTYKPSQEQSDVGYERELRTNQRVEFSVSSEKHYIGVKSMDSNKAVIEIASNPVEVELMIGEDKKVDVDSDGYYDIYVKLNSISGYVADFLIQTINEQIPESEMINNEDNVGSENLEENTNDLENISSKDSSIVWYVVIGIIIIGIVVWVFIRKKK